MKYMHSDLHRLLIIVLLFLAIPTLLFSQFGPSPDLIIKDVTVYDGIGPELDYAVEFQNTGDDSTENYFTLKVYLSEDAVINSGDFQIDQIAYAYYMQPDESFTLTRNNFSVHGLKTGSYYLGAIVDVDNWVPESNESNNSGYESSLMCAITALPDFTVNYVNVSHSSGTVYDYDFEWGNDSDDPQLDWMFIFTLISPDPIFTRGIDPIVDGRTILTNYIGAHDTRIETGSFDISLFGLTSGSYYFGVVVDEDNNIIESDETNNTGYDEDTILIYTTHIEYETPVVPEEYMLSQNRPNPFNHKTLIRFQIPKSEFVQLMIFDLTGKEIETLISESMGAGVYRYNWNAEHLSSGIYLCRLEAGDFIETRKLILQK